MILTRNLLRSFERHTTFVYKNNLRFCSDDDFKRQTKVQVTNENAQ